MAIPHVNFIDVSSFLEKGLEMFAESLLVHAAYYTMHKTECTNIHMQKPANPLFGKFNDYQRHFAEMRNHYIVMMQNEQREKEEKLYQAKVIYFLQ